VEAKKDRLSVRDPVYLRGQVYWCSYRGKNGRLVRKSTKCRDPKAARAVWRQYERQSVSGSDDRPEDEALADSLNLRLKERTNAGRAKGTLNMYVTKGKQLVRVLGKDTPIMTIDATVIDDYVSTRIKEGTERTTIQKELSVLRGTLRWAKRRGKYTRDLDEVMPEFSPKYKPKSRKLTMDELGKLLAELEPHRAAIVAYLVASGCTYPSEVIPFRKGDVDFDAGTIRIRGTKRESRDRLIPIVEPFRELLEFAVRFTPFERWSNIRRDMHAACARAGIQKLCPTDLRRTFGNVLRACGVEPQLIGPMMGQIDGRMAERVYGRLTPQQLAALIGQRLASAPELPRTPRVQTATKRSKERESA
jgi:integrase